VIDQTPDMIPDDARSYNGELADSFGFQERDALAQERFGYGGDQDSAKARRASRAAAWNRDHQTRRTARISAEQGQADRWTAATVASLRKAGEHRAAELVEARHRYFTEQRARDPRA
jgi:hypothetical protein